MGGVGGCCGEVVGGCDREKRGQAYADDLLKEAGCLVCSGRVVGMLCGSWRMGGSRSCPS
eukprot:12807903-Prorocentrum_lima.AAC.1